MLGEARHRETERNIRKKENRPEDSGKYYSGKADKMEGKESKGMSINTLKKTKNKRVRKKKTETRKLYGKQQHI